jgi:hypothetical protein
MNPFLLDAENGVDYIHRYFEFLSTCIHQTLGGAPRKI